MGRKLGMALGALLSLIAAPCLTTAGTGERTLRDLLPENWSWSAATQGPMCGVYAVCRTLAILGTTVDPRELWQPEFVGNPQGSSPEELMAALRAHGKTASIRSGLTMAELRSLGLPVIANVRAVPEARAFNHWVCVQAVGQEVVIYDGPDAGRFVTPAEFLATWSGIGIVVSESTLTNFRLHLVRLFGIGSLLILNGALLRLGRNGNGARQSTFAAVRRLGLAMLASLALGSLLYGVGPGHLDAVAIAAAPYGHPAYKQGSLDDVLDASHRWDSLVIDARLARDYARGTIGNAVNIPVSANYQEIKAFMKDVPRTARLVVFCQSRVCGYDEAVAKMLVQAGFSNVTVSDLGYAEYMQRANGSPAPPVAGAEA